MISPTSVAPVQPLAPAESSQSASVSGADFNEVLRSAIENVQASASHAGTMMESFLSGDTQDLHTVALAAQKAGLQFDMFLQVRNRLVQAYQEVMRMQL